MAGGRKGPRDDDPFGGESLLDALTRRAQDRPPRRPDEERSTARRAGDPRQETRPSAERPRGDLERDDRPTDRVSTNRLAGDALRGDRAREIDEEAELARVRELRAQSEERARELARTAALGGDGGLPEVARRRRRAASTGTEDESSFRDDLLAVSPRVIVTPLLVGLNVGVFVMLAVFFDVPVVQPQPGDLLPWGANFAPWTTGGEWWRLVSCMFLHFGLMHILLNMWVLKEAGPLVERLLGPVGFLVMYMGSGVVGSLASTWLNPGVVSAGASGAIFGVIGALLGVLVLGHGIIPRAVLGRLRRSVGTFVLLNIYLGFSVRGIDMAAHLGGLGMGLVCGLVMTRPDMLSTPEGRSGRDLTALALCSLAVVWLLVAVPEAQGGDTQVFLEADRIDREVAAAYRDAERRYDAGEIDEDALAAELDDLAGRLEAARAIVAEAAGDARTGPALEALGRLVDARLESYDVLRRYLETGSDRWFDEYEAAKRAVAAREAELR